MLRWIVVFVLSLSLFASSDAEAKRLSTLGVVTRNLYLGVDLGPLLTAPPEDFLDVAADSLIAVAQNNFLARAEALADEMALTRPDVIGLQEAFNFSFDLGAGPTNGPPPFLDMLAVFEAALQSRGLDYVRVAEVKNIDLTVPGVMVPGLGEATVGVLDRDVILVKASLAKHAQPTVFPCAKPSLDGCNFDAVAPLPPLLGGDVERGFVGVDLKRRGQKYRVVNTHLEVRFPAPDPLSAAFQSFQAQQLVGTLDATPLGNRKLIVIGDFNSAPEDEVIGGAIVPPYQQMLAGGYVDMWDRNLFRAFDPDGFTCCQDSDLSNPATLLDARIDLIFVKRTRFFALGWVIGDEPLGAVPNWASDHAGVFAHLLFKHHQRRHRHRY